MISTASSAFHTAARADINKPVARLTMTWTDPFIGSTNVVSTSSQDAYGGLGADRKSQMLLQTADINSVIPVKWAALDGTWELGVCSLTPSTEIGISNTQIGWRGGELSDSNGEFSTNQHLYINFGINRPIVKVAIAGDSAFNEWPVDYIVGIYDDSSPTPVLIHSITVTNNTSLLSWVDFTGIPGADAVMSMLLVVTKWSQSGTMVKISEFYDVITSVYSGDDIVSVNLLEETQADSATVPGGNMSINELNGEIQNISITDPAFGVINDPYMPDHPTSPYRNSLGPNIRVKYEQGFILPSGSQEFVNMGTFWTDSLSAGEDDFSLRFSARDRMELLRLNTLTMDEILINTNFGLIADYVLSNAKAKIPMVDLLTSVDSALYLYSVPYYWQDATYFEHLSTIIRACLGKAWVRRDDVIRLEDHTIDQSSGISDYSISRNEYFKHTKPINLQGVYNRVIVPVVSYLPGEDSEVFSKSYDMSTETTITDTVEFEDAVLSPQLQPLSYESNEEDSNGDPIPPDLSCNIFTQVIYTAHSATYTITKISGTTGNVVVKITGQKMEVTSICDAIAEDLTSYKKNNSQWIEYKLPENILIQSESLGQTIADNLLEILKNPVVDSDIEWPGDPSYEVGDKASIEVYSPDGIYKQFRCVKQEFDHSIDGFNCRAYYKRTIGI